MENTNSSRATRYAVLLVLFVPIIALFEIIEKAQLAPVAVDVLSALCGVLLGSAIVVMVCAKRATLKRNSHLTP